MRRQRFRHAAPRRRVHLLLLAAAGLVLVAVTSLAFSRAGGKPAAEHESPGPQIVAVAPEAVVSLPPTVDEQDGPIVWPADLTWASVAGLDLPVSATAGPRGTAGGRARGFAQTPAGAVLAAMHLVARTSPEPGPAVWEPTLREQVVGPDAAAYADAVYRDYRSACEQLHLPYGEPLGQIYATIKGVRLDAYTPEAVSLRLLVEGPGTDGRPMWASTVVQVEWVDDDWKLVAPPMGDWATVRTIVPATAVASVQPLPGR